MNQLMIHSGSHAISRDNLRLVPTPQSTDTWKPVPHYEAVCSVITEAHMRGFPVVNEEYGISRGGQKMFGVLTVESVVQNESWRYAIGLRNSHDQSLAFGITAGLSVCVCDNLVFGGETTIHRKHTSGFDIRELLPRAFNALENNLQFLERSAEKLMNIPVSNLRAKFITLKAAEVNAIPSSDIMPVLKEFKEPRHEEFRTPTMWSLHNSFTEIAKKYSAPRRDLCLRKLSGLFGLQNDKKVAPVVNVEAA